MSFNVTAAGFSELEKALADLPKAVQRGVMVRALMKAGEPVAAAMAAGAPTPGIRASIAISDKLSKSAAQKHRRAYANLGLASAVEVFVGPSYSLGSGAQLSHLFEFGTKDRFTRGGKKKQRAGAGGTLVIGRGKVARRGIMPMQPFVRPAWDQNARRSLDIIKAEIWTQIKKSAERQNRRQSRAISGLA